MLSGSRNEPEDSKRRFSTALAEVAEEHSEKTIQAKKAHRNKANNDSASKIGIDQSLKSHDTLNMEKKKPRKIIVLKDYNPANEEKIAPLTKISTNALNGSGN